MAKEIKYNKATTKNLLLITESEVPGTTQVTPEVIEVIAQIAAQEVSGVYSMRGNCLLYTSDAADEGLV